MDCYRRTGSADVFEALVRLTHDRLLRRVRARVRYMHGQLDPDELLQDAYINIFRYPDRFDGSRPTAFRAWSCAIVDNAVRRHLRRGRGRPEVSVEPIEALGHEAVRDGDPGARAEQAETCDRLLRAYCLFLALYLAAYERLSERERFVLQMVEVKNERYARVGAALSMRQEAVKMIVFRARRRLVDHIAKMLAAAV